MPKAVIFDVDGTLVDSVDLHAPMREPIRRSVFRCIAWLVAVFMASFAVCWGGVALRGGAVFLRLHIGEPYVGLQEPGPALVEDDGHRKERDG
ncbi:MAG: hypothetical protein JO166_12925 [Deltaproteobacteria bacterium]|nr:hypothetical protein [Deltaproteobacteria bacterium]